MTNEQQAILLISRQLGATQALVIYLINKYDNIEDVREFFRKAPVLKPEILQEIDKLLSRSDLAEVIPLFDQD